MLIASQDSLSKAEEWKSQLKCLRTYLSVFDRPEEDLSALQDARMVGSCEWIAARSYFKTWRDDINSPQFLWVHGKPATGKSVLASYVVDHLKEFHCDCSYFFFAHRHPVKSSLSGFLRSIAYQMALNDHEIRECLLNLQREDVQFDLDDEQAIWRKLFVAGIFRSSLPRQPHYWVLDAIDECSQSAAIFPLLAKIDGSSPLRVFVTSRDSNELTRSSVQLKSRVLSEEFSAKDNLNDIQAYTEDKVLQLDLGDDLACQYVTSRILEKSLGCFLWVKLVLQELDNMYTRSGIERVLEEVPEGMDPLYSRTLDSMSKQTPGNGKKLLQAILTWTMCAVHPLTIEELQSALQIDIGKDVYRLKQAVATTCGQLVYVDAKDRLQPVHETVRDYLLRRSDSEFAIPGPEGNSRLAISCLKYLTSPEMALPRNRRNPISHVSRQKRSALASYACVAFSEHLRRSLASDDRLIILVAKFLQSNVLTWIDFVAKHLKSLQPLTRTAKDLKLFLERRAMYNSPLGKEFGITDDWSIDLHRVATIFGKSLLSSPSAIYWLVPALCPTDSAIRKQFGRDARGVEVVGLSQSYRMWDDRASCLIYRPELPSAVACGESYFAVGFQNPTGSIVLYNTSTCQESRRFDHNESVKVLEFSSVGDVLASSGSQHIQIWNAASGNILFSFQGKQEALALAFTQNDTILMAATSDDHICSWDIARGGIEIESCPWHDIHGPSESQRFPSAVAFNQERSLLAVVHKGRPISLWDLENNSFLGYCQRTLSQLMALKSAGGGASHPHVESIVFNPKSSELAASYADGELCLFDSWSQNLLAQEDADPQILACSPDGRTLASGDAHGSIQLRDFETLRLMYKIAAYDDPIRAIAFTSNSLRFLDIRGSTCNVWEPSALVRPEEEDDMGTSESIPRPSGMVESQDADDIIRLTAMVCHSNGTLFVGKEDGVVAVYDAGSGCQTQALYRHAKDVTVSALAWCETKQILVSADVASRFVVVSVTVTGPKQWESKRLFECRLQNQAIRNIVLSTAGDRLLVSTSTSDTVYSLDGKLVNSSYHTSRASQKWLNHPLNADQLITLNTETIRLFDWQTFHELCFQDVKSSDFRGTSRTIIKRIVVCTKQRKILIRLSTSHAKGQTNHLRLLDPASLEKILPESSPDTQDRKQAPLHNPLLNNSMDGLSKHLESIIGAFEGEVIFLDTNLWVCTVDIEVFPRESYYTRHFFIPHYWVTTDDELVIHVTAQKDVVFVKQDKIAVIKRGFQNGEKVMVS